MILIESGKVPHPILHGKTLLFCSRFVQVVTVGIDLFLDGRGNMFDSVDRFV